VEPIYFEGGFRVRYMGFDRNHMPKGIKKNATG
jgi:hypothetical protein